MALVISDDSFKKAGAIPFKWETRPGVSKFQHQSHEPQPPLSSSPSSFGSTSFDSLAPSKELQTKWLQSMSLSTHTKNRASFSLTRLGLFLGQNGRFSIPWSRLWSWRKKNKGAKPKLKLKLEFDPECMKDNTFSLEKLARWSIPTSQRSSTSSFSRRIQRAVPDQSGFSNDNDDEADPSFSARIQRAVPDQSGFSNDDEAARLRFFDSLLGFLRRPNMIGMGTKGREKKEINISVYVVNTKE